jgi:hypothetical protein
MHSHQRDSPKVNVFCAVSREKVNDPCFFTEATVAGDSFLDMLENWLLPQLNTNYDDYSLQLDGALPHFHMNVRILLNCILPQCKWRQQPSPLATPFAGSCTMRFLSLGVYEPSLPLSIQELHDQIMDTLQAITADMLHHIRHEFYYRVGVM